MTILVADDDRVARLTFAKILTRSGHKVVEAEDGEAAWAILQERDAPKLALLDWIMPKMDGLEVIRKVRASVGRDPVYMMLITSRNGRQDRVRGLKAGADDYLTKPVDPVELKARIKAAERIVQLQASLSQRVIELQSALGARRQLQEALLKEQHHFHSLMAHLPDAIYFKDAASRFTRINKTQAQRMGLADPSEAIGKSDFDFFTPEHAQPAFEDEQEIIRTGEPMVAKEEKETWPDGTVTWVVSSKMPLRQTNGEITGTFGVSHDITQRREAEEANRFLASIVEASTDAISGVSLDGTIASWNLGAELMYGYRADEVKGKPISILIPPERAGETDQIVKELKQGKQFANFETVRLAKDGRRIDVSLTVFPITDSQGRITGSAAIARDITASKRAEKELRQEKSRAQMYFDIAGAMLLVLNPDQEVVRINAKGCQILGYKSEEVVGKRWCHHFVAVPDRDWLNVAFANLAAGETERVERLENRVLTKAGEVRLISWHNTVIRDEAGKIVATLSSGEDITERKRAEEELSLERNLLRTLIDTMPDSVFVKDTEGRVVIDNVAHRRLIGAHTQAEVVGKTVFDYFPSEFASRYAADERAVLASGQPLINREEPTVDQKRNPRWLSTDKVPLRDQSGNTIGIVGVSHDITDQKAAAEELIFKTALLEAQSETTIDGILVVDEVGKVVLSNRRFASIFRLPRQLLEARDDSPVLEHVTNQAADSLAFLERVKYLYAHQKEKSRDEVQLKDGRTLDRYSSPLVDSSGRYWGRVWYFRDITERKQAEEALRASEQRYRRFLERNTAGVIRNGADGTVLDCNAAVLGMLGYDSAEEFKTHRMAEFYCDPRDRDAMLAILRREKLLTGYEFRFKRKDGTLVWLLGNMTLAQEGNREIVEATVIDITERKRAEEELRKLSRVVEQSPASVIITDRQGLIEYVNPAFSSVTGYSLEEVIGKNPSILKSGLTAAETYRELWQTLLDGGEWRGELANRKKSGELYWESASISPLKDAQGITTHFLAIKEDITERKQAEQALKASENRYRQLFERNPSGVLRSTLDGRVLDCNKSMARILGYRSPRELAERDTSELWYNPADRQKMLTVVKELGSLNNCELCLRRKDGGPVWAIAGFNLVESGAGEGAVVESTVVDISWRKEAEEALRRSEERARLLFATIPHPAYLFDCETLDFLEVNDAAVQRYGYSRDEFLRMKTPDISPAEEVERLKKYLKDVLKDIRTVPRAAGEWKQRTKDGRIMDVEITQQILDYNGRLANLVIAQDITARKRLEVDLRQAQKLEAVGQLAAGIAHEINTPIQFVGDNTQFIKDAFRNLEKLLTSYAELRRAVAGRLDDRLLDGLVQAELQADWEYLKDEVPKALEQTLDGVSRVSRIVRAMKDFSHVGRSGEKAAADLNRALESTLVVARNELKYVADVETEFGDIPPVVCNLGDLNQVFLNLLVNAAHAIGDVVKGTGDKGKIRVRTWQEREQVVVAISDTGGGVPEEIREKIFEPFFTTKEVGKGTGQGLTLARNVVVGRHGGSLTFASELGNGSTFFVRLPIGGSGGDGRGEGSTIAAEKVALAQK